MRAKILVIVGLIVTLVGASAAPAAADPVGLGLTIEVVSSPHPNVVTGGDALLKLSSFRPLQLDNVRVQAGGHDVTGAFTEQPDGTLLGLVTGLREGHTAITAHVRHGFGIAVEIVKNHPITGPVFSGPQQVPFFCETTAFGLAPAEQPNCAAPTVVSYLYRSTANRFVPLADPSVVPADAATATVDGRAVPYIVRLERGTIDRAVYEIAALYDGQNPSPVRAHGAWNRRLVYTFGGGCNVGYHQGATTGGVQNDLFLARGFAVASSSLNVLDNNCSPVISAEVAMMVKEHFIEEYGPVAHTIGWGASGGAIQQYQIADNYPGILDGIVPQLSFPDPTTTGPTVGDCRLLNRYFTANPTLFTPAQRTAASGYRAFGSCVSWDTSFASRGNPTEACPPAIPVEFLYNPTTNPGGIKCTSTEQWANQLGRDPDTGFVRSVTDNIGVQYGLAALNAGQITVDQFLDLNEKVGGFDINGNSVPARNEADLLGLFRVYRSGLVTFGGNGLATTPAIDLRVYTDAVNDIHTRFWSFTARQRLIDANGDADTQVILAYGLGLNPAVANPQLVALQGMDAWLTAIEANHASKRSDVVAAKPADLVDGCWNATGARINEPATWQGAGSCNTLYPSFADTRISAGAPLRDDVLKCHLKPVDLTSYAVPFTLEQQARLAAVFPTGVCDYTRKGVAQVRPDGVWQHF
jgi:Tannase-like family of unknown function (DUF6351)